jgi:hypothetical protein
MLPTYYVPGACTLFAVYSAQGNHVAWCYAPCDTIAVATVRMYGRACATARSLK